MKNAKKVTEVSEEQLLKALGELEASANESEDEEIEKAEDAGDSPEDAPPPRKGPPAEEQEDESSEESEPAEEESEEEPAEKSEMPANTRSANGGEGFPTIEDEDKEHFETNAEENEPGAKTMKSLVRENTTIRKGFEVSKFLEELTDSVVEAVDGLQKSVIDGQNSQAEFNDKVQNALIALGNTVLEIKRSIVETGDEPVTHKPRAALNKSDVQERFEERQDGAPQFTREDTLTALTDMAIKGEIPTLVVSAYESSGFVPPEHIPAVNAKLRTMAGGR